MADGLAGRGGDHRVACHLYEDAAPGAPEQGAGGGTGACRTRPKVNAVRVRWTRPLQSLLSAGDGLIDRMVCVVGAVLFSQLPEFIQQYLQRLGGHLDEARRQLEQFQAVAAKSGLTFHQLVANSLASTEPTVARLGGVMRDTADRVDALAAADAAIRHASMFTRPLVFLRHIDLSDRACDLDDFQAGGADDHRRAGLCRVRSVAGAGVLPWRRQIPGAPPLAPPARTPGPGRPARSGGNRRATRR